MILIVCGGEAPNRTQLTNLAQEASLIIAADSGASHCLAAGLRPSLVVGDMDSITAQDLATLERDQITLIRHAANKDQTDSQLALDLALEHSPAAIYILGACGDRPDHSLANIHLLSRAARRGVSAHILTTAGDEIFLISDCATITGHEGCTLSILPFGGRAAGICLKGFRYPLIEATMEPWEPYGISNVIESDSAEIKVKTGQLLAFMIHA